MTGRKWYNRNSWRNEEPKVPDNQVVIKNGVRVVHPNKTSISPQDIKAGIRHAVFNRREK